MKSTRTIMDFGRAPALALLIISSLKLFSQSCPPTPYGSTVTSNCGPATLELTAATQGTFGTVTHKWYTTQNGSTQVSGVYVKTNSPGIYVTALSQNFSSNTSYWVSAVQSGCTETSRVEVKAVINPPTAPNITPSSPPYAVCTNQSFTLTATSGSAYDWRYNTVDDINASSSAGTTQVISPSTSNSGYYWVKVNGSCGWVASAYIQVTFVTPLDPQVTISKYPSGSVCAGASVQLTANPSEYMATPTYYWTIGSNHYTTKVVNYTVNSNVTASVTMTSNDNCVTHSTDVANTNLSLWPNPNVVLLTGAGGYCHGEPGDTLSVYNPQNTYLYHCCPK